MQRPRPGSHGDRLGQEDDEVRAAARFAVVAAASGVGFVILAALWVSTCGGEAAVDTAACGVPQRTVLAFGGPAILFGAGVWAFVRTYRVWRDEGTWWGWHGAGWFLLTLMMLTMTLGTPAISGLTLGG
ncbi:hypothetical protein [Mycobacterium talmoniae]|uniref:Transmembrane protein n=1 Tax=Mycobacterium talmoniae TaxID=1858794 RepID=A0A1S1MWL8_9MYCO|nr:hypothetical protein [Mycobacterium talmoniae]OHU93292.1 hypothetical protein BKN37_24320 [Mycobacterium talmoniae]